MTAKPRLRAFPFALFAVGLGMAGWYGVAWYELPRYNADDITASVELNLQLDLQRLGPAALPDAAGIERLRQRIRSEVEADIRQEREALQKPFVLGLLAMIAGLGQMVWMRWSGG